MTTVRALDGTWQLLPVDAFRQGFYPREDRAWVEQTLPAHWQQHPLFERYSGKMVYRKRFALQEAGIPNSQLPTPNSQLPTPNFRHWLRFNGVFYRSQVYCNGVDLGRAEGYFLPHEREITPWLAEDNTLIVEVDCPDEHNKFGKQLITGVFSHWDCIDPATNPGGIWLPVELITTGAVRIKETQIHTEQTGSAAAELRFNTVLDAGIAHDVTLRWTIAPANFVGAVQVIEQPRALAVGEQTISGTFSVRDPYLWWTHDMGHPNCYTIQLEVISGGAASDTYQCTFGIRTFEMRKWIAYLNGKRMFIKGSNYAPGDTRIATMTPERYAQDMELVQRCHMNMLRVHAHVEHPAFYEAADRAGVLVWQDFPLQWLYRRSVLPEARRQARGMVRLLYNHPALVVWCMHNEPLYNADTRDEQLSTIFRTYVSVFIWNWNRDVMDTQLKQVAEAEDSRRLVVRSSGEYAIPFGRSGTDTHFYFGWYMVYGPLKLFNAIARWVPKNVRFVTEFGTQSFPNLESATRFMDADIRRIDWQHLVDRHLFQSTMLDHWMDWRSAESLEQLIAMTQNYQAAINRFYIDRLRFFKYRPTGGIVPFLFHDPNPAVLWSVLDYWRVPKRSYYALQQAFSPQYIFSVLEHDAVALGAALELPIYVVNDAQRDVPVTISVLLSGPNGEALASLAQPLTLPVDCMALEIERLRLRPDVLGVYTLALTMHGGDGGDLAHEYRIVVQDQATIERNKKNVPAHALLQRKRTTRAAREPRATTRS